MNEKPGNKTHATTRRAFLGNSVAAASTIAVPWIVSASALGLNGEPAPSEKITLGVIGIGGRCRYDLKAMLQLKDVKCVAIAEVQASRRDVGKAMVDEYYGNSDCKFYRDFRELLARKDIDAVLIATGDRWHAPASILAAEAGKDVYSEKPCGLTIANCQQLDDVIQKTGRIFQAGTQRRSVPNFQTAIRLARSGELGKIHTLFASVYKPELKNDWLPAEPTPDREKTDWNMWLGPAPWRPFNQKYVEGKWRGYYDFDSGSRLLDWGAHTLDLCQAANNADDTMPIEYEPGEMNITCHYANGVKVVLDFLKAPFGDRGPNFNTKLGTCPVRFEGDAGSVETGDAGGIDVSSEKLRAKLNDEIKKTLELDPTGDAKNFKGTGIDVSTHARNFFDSIKSRKPAVANSKVMRHSHIACHAAATAWMLKRKLKFDPAKEIFINDDEANSLRSRPARSWA
jgi:predicted dehydrogenase